MDPRLLSYYNQELRHVRETAAEFATEFPKIAGRLGLEGFECADPYVERLLEGFAFLAARIQLKIDAEFPRFSKHLLEVVFPQYLAPTPSMVVAQLQPQPDGALADGFAVERGSVMRSVLGKGDRTPCEYLTAHDVTLWPLEVAEAAYYSGPREVQGLNTGQDAKAAVRLRLRTMAGLTFDKLSLESLPIFLQGSDELPARLYEQIFADATAVVVRPAGDRSEGQRVLGPETLGRVGFDDDQALLPHTTRSFAGYRLLREYFAFRQRFLFVELEGLGPSVRGCQGKELDLLILFDREDPMLESSLDASHFALFCTPAINLFPKRADRINVTERRPEHHVVADRTKPMDFEVYDITSVTGIGTGAGSEQDFLPLYASYERRSGGNGAGAYYTVQRVPRMLSHKQRGSKQKDPQIRSSYIGSEVFLSLVDTNEAPYPSNLRELSLTTLCTNRDLPLLMPLGTGKTDFTLESGAPLAAIRCVAGPTRPRSSYAEGTNAWRLISHLSLNYLSLLDNDEQQGAAALRDLLRLYTPASDPHRHRQKEVRDELHAQVEGVRSVSARPITKRMPVPGPITFGRGLEIRLTLDDGAYEGVGPFLLGAVLAEFFRRYVSVNSFTETVLSTPERGEVMRWAPKMGRRHTL